MKQYTVHDRINFYRRAGLDREFPGSCPFLGEDGRMSAIWFGGQNYQGSGFHGSFPPTYLRRIEALFPDREVSLHLFSGSLPKFKDATFRCDLVDRTGDVEIIGNAEKIDELWVAALNKAYPGLKVQAPDWVHADPPYTEEDANHYGVPMVNRNAVVQACARMMKKGSYLLWYDMVLPMYSSKEWTIDGVVGHVRSTNHRFRMTTIFRRLG